MQFSLFSSTASGSVPFCLGFAFRKGDIPPGSGVLGSIANLQVTPKNRWSDGSLKFAVVAGRAALSPSTPLTVSLSSGAAGSGADLTLADLKATGATASVGCGAYGTVNWAGADWEAPLQAWVSGPEMSSWIYRKPVGSDAHLVAWLEVRLFADGSVEVLPWIENGYLRIAGPTNKSATYTFSLGGTQRFSAAINLLHHCRTPLVSGSVFSYWLGADPGVIPRHDVAYMQASELVPSYRAVNTPARAAQFVQTFTPLQQGNYSYDGDMMSSPGYAGPIGLLPFFDVIYLTANGDPAAYRSVVFNGYSSGRYGRYYRDEATQRPVRVSQYPTLVVSGGASNTNNYTPAPTGGNGVPWAPSHHPSIGYMAYLLTGRWYFMETIQFSAATQMLATTDWIRGNANCVVNSDYENLPRGAAWKFRTLAQALCVTPDDDTGMRNEFKTSVENTIEHHHALYVRGVNSPVAPTWTPGANHVNNLGVVLVDIMQYLPHAELASTWTDDFFTGAWGYALSLDLPVSAGYAAKLREFFHWKAKFVVGRLGPSDGWWYINPCTYYAFVRPGGTSWASSFAQAYALTYSKAPLDGSDPNPYKGATEGTLAGEYGVEEWAKSQWGNLQPAIAYAVRHGVAGATAAYARMTQASNWPALEAGFTNFHVWSVRPAAM